jgi:hypothetical protein
MPLKENNNYYCPLRRQTKSANKRRITRDIHYGSNTIVGIPRARPFKYLNEPALTGCERSEPRNGTDPGCSAGSDMIRTTSTGRSAYNLT